MKKSIITKIVIYSVRILEDFQFFDKLKNWDFFIYWGYLFSFWQLIDITLKIKDYVFLI